MHAVRRLATLQGIGLTAIVLLLSGANSAHATNFAFTFTSGLTNAYGILNASLNPDLVSYTATSGSVTVAGPPSVTGTFGLFLNPNGTAQATSPSGFFLYDNQLFPASNPTLNSNGLLFTGNGVEINLFNQGGDIYYENTNFNTFGQFTLTPIPEPAFYQAGVFLALGGVGFIRNRRKRVTKAE